MIYDMHTKLSPEDQDLYYKYKVRARPKHAGKYEAYIGSDRALVSRIVMERVESRKLGSMELVDHINGDTLDNRRSNLRITTHLQNSANMTSTRGTSKYKGVYFLKSSGKWRAQLSLAGLKGTYLRLNLGHYDTPEEAARVYNGIAKEWYGPYARLNKITRRTT